MVYFCAFLHYTEKILILLLLICISAGNSFSLSTKNFRPSPVLLVPGDGGTQLEAKLDKPETVHYLCSKKSDYFTIWLNLELLVPIIIDCWVDNMRLVYNNVTRTTSNTPGVYIRAPGFGNTSQVEWLDPDEISPSSYFVNIVKMLVSLGYQRGVDVRGAPFDFRKAPNEMGEFFSAFKNMTEETFSKNEDTPVTIICHSMGCPVMSYFLGQQKQAWKEKYIKTLISLAGAWGGSVKAVKTFASGENLDVFAISDLSLRAQQRTTPSLAYLMPSNLIWKSNETLVITDARNYTVNDYYDFFKDIEWPNGFEMFKDTYPYAFSSMKPPGVEVHCLHGFKMQTVEKLDYRNTKHFPDNPILVLGDGDGTVNRRSLEFCQTWQGLQPQKVFHIPFKGVEHLAILALPEVLEYIKQIVLH